MSNVRRIQNRHKAKAKAEQPQRDDYWFWSARPLHAAVFLLPLVVAYELASAFFLTSPDAGTTTRIQAERLINVFFEHFGVAGLLVPGITVLTVLLVMHILQKDRWSIKPLVVVGMYFESALWVLPLLVMSGLVTQAMAHAAHLETLLLAGGPSAGGGVGGLTMAGKAAISVGAGIYEELLFRLIGIGLLHLLLRDVLKLEQWVAGCTAVLVSAVAFAVYHNTAVVWNGLSPTIVSPTHLAFFTCAGVYFGVIYLTRGFGVVVGTHAMYDLAVLVILPMSRV